MTRMSAILLSLLLASCTAGERGAGERPAAGSLGARYLRCEWQVEPIGIDVGRPRLTWELASEERGQLASACQVLCATSPQLLEPGRADLWDSGILRPGREVQVVYDGAPLASRDVVWWTVRVLDAHGRPSPWSEPARFELGLLDPVDWVARWVGNGRPASQRDEDFYREDPAPLLRREFELPGPVRNARLYVTGLGWYEAWINGERVGDRALDPLWTSYAERVLYSTYDVTELVREGPNAIGAMLGKGWYDPLPLRMWGRLNLREHLAIGRPRLLAQLEVELEDGSRLTVASDESWVWADGPVRRDNVYLGEVYDARAERPGWSEPGYDASGWEPARLDPTPVGALHAQAAPPIRVLGTLPAVRRSEPTPGTWILDLGENFAGWVRLTVEGTAGTQVRLRYGELLHADGTLNPLTSVCGQIKGPGVGGPGAPDLAVQADTYVLRGGGPETWTPRFTFHAFRYVEVTGWPGEPPLDAVVGLRLGCDLEPVGTFSSSSERLARIDAMVRRTFRANVLGVQSDCPHRERFGYGGDIVATADAFLGAFDMAGFYSKVVRDFADDADGNGVFPMTAPYVGIAYAGLEEGGSPIGWSIAHPVLVHAAVRYLGDRALADEQYEALRRYVEYVRAQAGERGVLERGLSDHESLEQRPVRVTSTAFYARATRILADLADLLGRQDDGREYAALAARIGRDFADELIQGTTGVVDNGTQGAQAIALAEGLVPAASRASVLRRLLDEPGLREDRLSTGIFGTPALLEALSASGHADLAWALVDRDAFPGWGHMLQSGATTLWEHWELSENTFSHNHPMFGSVRQWMVEWLAGLAPAPDAIGFDRVLVRPQPVAGLDHASASYRSVRGPVRVAWRVEDGRFTLEVELPPSTSAELHLPAGCDPAALRESGLPVRVAPGVEALAPGRLRLGSGRYRFETSIQR
jgi:alpha-L-rhamnosidase